MYNLIIISILVGIKLLVIDHSDAGVVFLMAPGVILLFMACSYDPPTCAQPGCSRTVHGSDRYCCVHDYYRGVNSRPSGSTSTSSSRSASSLTTTSNSSATSYGSSRSSSSSSRTSSDRRSMPNCDDYEDFDEFMDIWDGNMPDGSDAEEYWDNW